MLHTSQWSGWVGSGVDNGPGPAQQSSSVRQLRVGRRRGHGEHGSLGLQPSSARLSAPPTCTSSHLLLPRPPLPCAAPTEPPGTRLANPYPTATSAGKKGSCSGDKWGGKASSHLLRGRNRPAWNLPLPGRPGPPRDFSNGPQPAGSLPVGVWGWGWQRGLAREVISSPVASGRPGTPGARTDG